MSNGDPWKVSEERVLRDKWAAGWSLNEIAALMPGRSIGALRSHRDRLKLHRAPEIGTERPSRMWSLIVSALKLKPGMSTSEIVAAAGCSKASAVQLIKANHGKGLYVMDWRETTRKPAALWAVGNLPDAPYPIVPVAQRIGFRKAAQLRREVNPFATAMGLAAAPAVAQPGRVYRQSMSVTDDELEAA